MKDDLIVKLINLLINENAVINNGDNNSSDINYPYGEYVIVRCRDAGVHYGILESVNGRTVKLTKTRRMWRWWAKTQMSLSAVAEFGLNEEKDLRIQNELEQIILLEACEIIKCSKDCIESFKRVAPYNEQ